MSSLPTPWPHAVRACLGWLGRGACITWNSWACNAALYAAHDRLCSCKQLPTSVTHLTRLCSCARWLQEEAVAAAHP